MYIYLKQQLYRRKNRRWVFTAGFFVLILIYVIIFNRLYIPFDLDRRLMTMQDDTQSVPPFDRLIPSNTFDLFWTIWNTDQSTFRGRHLLALESLFIHHPQVTVIMLSSTLDDTKIFLPFRRRGYQIYAFDISLQHIIGWNWYSNKKTKDFLQHWNTSGTHFNTHLTDYLRTVAMYLYGGTYMDMDALILQPLPDEEFIGLHRRNSNETCDWCIRDKSSLYLTPSVMRFQPDREVFRRILEDTFDREVYDPSCLNCLGPITYTQHIITDRNNNKSELSNLQLLDPHRLYPFSSSEISKVFLTVEPDTSLELDDLMKRSYSIGLFGHISNQYDITRGSLIDRLFYRHDLGDLRGKTFNRNRFNNDIRLICPSLYVYTRQKEGRFIGRDTLYLRLNQTFGDEHVRWNITIYVADGTVILPRTSLLNLNQAQINRILNKLKYKPFQSTSTDKLMIDVKREDVSVSCSVTILIFSKWVTFLTKTMGTSETLPAMQRLISSIDRYFPQTMIFIASDSGQTIDETSLYNSASSDSSNDRDLASTIAIFDLPEDSGLSKGRNYLVNKTRTPFFFLLDDDFEFEEDSHLDLLLELIYTYRHIDIIAGKIPEDIREFNDFSGIFLRYGQTLELVYNASKTSEEHILFPRSDNKRVNDGNPCRQVDFVPNVFMGRTESFRTVFWDDDLKVGEHEDFFLRFGQANRNVYSCRYIHVHHRQIAWWKKVDDPYYKKRRRVYSYFEKMLKKHHLKKLITFNYLNIDLDRQRS